MLVIVAHGCCGVWHMMRPALVILMSNASSITFYLMAYGKFDVG